MKNNNNIGIEEVKNLTDELTFFRQFLDETKAKELKKDLDEIKAKINNFKINMDTKFLEELKKELTKKQKEFAETIKKDIRLYEAASKELQEERHLLLNTLNEIKKESKKAVRNTYILNKVNIFTTIVIFVMSAIMGSYIGTKYVCPQKNNQAPTHQQYQK